MKPTQLIRTALCGLVALAAAASAQTKKPTILIIMGEGREGREVTSKMARRGHHTYCVIV